jgi:hypothetical protein
LDTPHQPWYLFRELHGILPGAVLLDTKHYRELPLNSIISNY